MYLRFLQEDQKKYGQIIFDFRYLKSVEYYENRIENSAELLELDAEFKENHMEILRRFYALFESIYKYGQDYLRYLEDLEEGVFIQQTLESVLLNNEGGKQLMSEALYLYGAMMLLLDERIDGVVRERMLISHLRYRGQSELPQVDEVCALLRSSGYVRGRPYPPGYPEEYLARLKVPLLVVKMVLGRLRTDDIYNQIQCYPLPEHRSTALATQAQQLYVILWLAPDILKNEQAIMREIVDKFFADNWVLAYYLGYTVDLSVVWEPYRAAKQALANALAPQSLRSLHQRHISNVERCIQQLDQLLTEGLMTDDYVMDNTSKLLAAAREANVTLRWLILHSHSQTKRLRELVQTGLDPERLLLLLLKTAQFEFVLRRQFEALLATKQERWDRARNEAAERMKELADYFSGERLLARGKRNENLQKWFLSLSEKIQQIDYADSTKAGRRIQQLTQALLGVEQYQEIDENLQVKQFLADTRSYLTAMIRVVNIKDEYLAILQGVADISYAQLLINDYVELMQRRIKADPSSVLLLRAAFLKLASILDLPLVRILQANSPDLVSVSEYYSSVLVEFVRRVLEVIPRSMFASLREIIQLQTTRLRELPTKVEKERLKEYAQLEDRFALARATHAISVLTEGILSMQTTLVGVIKVDPRQLLEDGLRRELVSSLAALLDRQLVFRPGARIEELEQRLEQLAAQLDGLRRSFQYIQDYVAIYALKVWQEEFSRIVLYNVEQECNAFLRKKVYDWQSAYQRRDIPIPRFPPPPEDQSGSLNFIGRLARELIAQSAAPRALYLDPMAAWYSPKDGRELVGLGTFSRLLASIGVFGLTGLDRLYSFMLVRDLQDLVRSLRRDVVGDKAALEFLAGLARELEPLSALPLQATRVYPAAFARLPRLASSFPDTVARIGQLQLLRRQIQNILNFTCKLDSNALFCALDTLNQALLSDLRSHYRAPETHPYPGGEAEKSPLLAELARFLDTAGIADPLTKIYVTSDPLDQLPLICFVLVANLLSRYAYSQHLGVLMPRSKETPDATALVVGMVTLLRQFHSIHTQQFLAHLGQYVRSVISLQLQGKDPQRMNEMPPEATNALVFLEEFCKFSGLSRKVIEGYLPAHVFDTIFERPAAA